MSRCFTFLLLGAAQTKCFMNRIAFTLLTLLLGASMWGQGGQPIQTAPRGLSSIVGPNDTYHTPSISPGEYVPGELIVYFEKPDEKKIGKFRKDINDSTGWSFVSSSPLGHYALIRDVRKSKPGPTGPTPADGCSLIGDGNNLINSVGGGDGVDLNYVMGTDFVIHNNHFGTLAPCLPFGTTDVPDLTDYEADAYCSNQYELIPPSGSSPVHIGVIDGGVYSRFNLSNTSVSGIAVNQVIFPLTPDQSLGPDDFSIHGKAILSLIAGQFIKAGKEDNLSLSSYKVMDENLRATAFDVASAIEYAADPGTPTPQVLSISIGFQPLNCGIGTISDLKEDNILKLAIDEAEAHNIIVVTSAGNNGQDLGTTPQYPAAEQGVGNLLTVGALSCSGSGRSTWSNYSSSLVDLLTTGQEVNIVVNHCFQIMSGTSFSCPIVAAKAGLHISTQDSYNFSDVMCQLSSQTVPNSSAFYGAVDANAYQNNCIIVEPGNGGEDPDPGIEIDNPVGGVNVGQIPENIGGGFTVSPNPTGNNVRIMFQGQTGDNATLTIMDTGGNQVLEQPVRTATVDVDLSSFRPGIYFASVRSSNGVNTKRIVKR